MRAYTILVDESLHETLPGDTPSFPGVVVEGGSLEGCLDQGREAITLYLADLAAARHDKPDGPAAAPRRAADGSRGGAGGSRGGAGGLADEEAVDALRRAGAALDTVEADLLAELVRRHDPRSRADLRRAHVALLKARTALTGAGPDS